MCLRRPRPRRVSEGPTARSRSRRQVEVPGVFSLTLYGKTRVIDSQYTKKEVPGGRDEGQCAQRVTKLSSLNQ